MSAIFGIFNTAGQPVDPGSLDGMRKAMDYWGPDGFRLWREGPVGLGHLMLHNTPESLNETLPAKSRSGDFIITAAARLDNREELFESLGIPAPERPLTTDSELILKTYEKWGEACPDHLLGDWAFAIWDARRKMLFLARDHHGVTGLYYFHSSELFAFSTSFKGLFALPATPRRPNDLVIAQVFLNWCASGTETVYKDIFRLPPAHALTVTFEEKRIWRYWRLEDTPPLRLGSDREYVEAFLEVYAKAVSCRLRSLRKVGMMLSGGLDSGSVAALAARELRDKNERLPAFSSVPVMSVEGLVDPDHFGNERPFIEEMARFTGNIDPTYITAADVSPVAGIQKTLDLLNQPLTGGGNEYWLIGLLRAAQDNNIGVLLTGQEGNNTVSWSGRGYLAALARQGRWGLLQKELNAWRSIHHVPLWRAIAGQVVRPLIPPGPLNRYRRRVSGRDPWFESSALNPKLALRLAIAQRMAKAGHDFAPKPDTRQERFTYIRPGKAWHMAYAQAYGAGFGLELRDPTADKRVMEYCLAIPDDQFFYDGVGRLLVRRALAGLLPPRVLWNPRRGLQAADIVWRLRENREETFLVFEWIKKSELVKNYLNIKKMDDIVTLLRQENLRNEFMGISEKKFLLSGLMMGLFLMLFDEATGNNL